MRSRNVSLLIAFLFVFSSVVSFGQSREHRKGKKSFMHGLELTDAQKTKMKDIRKASQSEMVQWKSEQNVLQAELKAIQVKDKPSQSGINRKINQLTVLQAKMMKERAATHQKVRMILTADQRVTFDKHFLEGRKMKKGKNRKGRKERKHHQGDNDK